MKYNVIRGCALVCAFLCALMIGAGEIGKISDYQAMINSVLGGESASAGSAETYAFTSQYEDTVSLMTARKKIAEDIGEEGCVLLRNDGVLPLTATENAPKKVTVLGSRAYTYDSNGGLRDTYFTVYGGIVGSPIRRQTVTVEEGTIDLPITLERGLASQNILINPALVNAYSTKNFPSIVDGSEANGTSSQPFAINEPEITLSECGNYSEYSDACFVVIGRSSGEGREYLPGPNGLKDKSDGAISSLGLSGHERDLIALADQIAPGKVVVLLNSAVAMEIEELKTDERVDAVMWIGLPGSYGMNGVARVIGGAAAPSGRLSDTYAVDASVSPAAQNFGPFSQDGESFTWNDSRFKDTDNAHYSVLAEGLYAGYYYYETRYADTVEGRGNASSAVGMGYGEPEDATGWTYENEVVYPFGYGLSYTEFEQSIVEDTFVADYENKTVSVQVRVRNVGDVAAKSPVQLYMQSPYTDYDVRNGIEKSAIQLVSFGKSELLYPASQKDADHPDEQTIMLTVPMKYLASYDKKVAHDDVVGGYILEDADYYFAVGNGAHEALNNILAARGYGEEELYLEEGSKIAADAVETWRPDATAVPFTNGVNATFLAVSEGGKVIENQLADVDYNYFNPGSVTYLSRSAWDTTFPKAYPGLAVAEGMELYLNNRVYQFKTGTVTVEFGVDHSSEEDDSGEPLENLTVADMKLAAFDDERWDYLIEQITFDEAWALAPYGGTYCNMFKSVSAPEVWQIDGPNGNVTRSLGEKAPKSGTMAVAENDPNAGYMSCDMPCEPMVAATFDPELVERQGEANGEDMLWSRNGMAWSPGMNLHRTPYNSRNHEYYSEDPMLTNILGTHFVRGGLKRGAILAAKHFAFNTQESFREGLSQMMEEQSARELELRGFQGIFEDVNYVNPVSGTEHDALGLMSSFSRVGVCGVNAHTGLMKNILRGEWGFKGLSSTDMVVGGRFFNPQDAVINNVTFLATSNGDNLLQNFWPEYNNKEMVRSDPELTAALSENMHYYMYAIANSNALNGISPGQVLKEQTYWWQTMITVLAAVFGAGTAGLIAYGTVLCVRKNKREEEGSDENN